MKKMIWLACCIGLLTGASTLNAATEMQKRVPVRFSYESGNGNFNEDTGWQTLVPYWSQFRGYLLANSIPYGFTANAYLVFAFNPEDVYAGNSFSCRVWLEPSDEAGITELYSDFGFELGVEFRNYWVDEVTLGLSKDFRLNIQGDGPLPLGDTLLGGMDYVDFLSIPVDELLPGAGEAVKVIQGLLKVADYSNLGIGSISLGGEVVVEGNYFYAHIGDHVLTFQQYGEAHAQTTSVYVPIRDYSLQDFMYDIHPIYNASLYKSIGYALTIIEPLSLSYSPTQVSRLGNFLPGNYEPPNREWLHDGPYQKAVDGVGLEADTPWVTISFPVNQRPNMPDLTVYDITVNPESGWGKGRAYADEVTLIRYSLGNFGERATQADANWIERSRIDRDPDQILWLNNRGFAPHLALDVNAVTQLYVYAYFTNTGMHTVYLSTGYLEKKGLDGGGAPIYGLGDGNLLNNVRTVDLYVHPRRGTIMGRLMTNPDYPDSGINGIPVRLSDVSTTRTVISSMVGGENGIFRFDNVPTGEVVLEYLPNPPVDPKDPDYWPMSFHFQHEGGDTDDLRERGGMYLVQYQTFTGTVCEADNPTVRIPDTKVQFGDKRFDGVISDANGKFGFARLPPRGSFVLVFDHPEYAPKRILVELSVMETEQRHSPLTRYYDYDTDTMIDSGSVLLARDNTPPVVELFAFERNACTGLLAYAFCGTDDGGARLPSFYQARVLNLSGGALRNTAWLPYDAPTGTLNRVQTTWDLSTLAAGTYQLEVRVRDPAGNGATSARQTFTIDRTPPAFTVSIAGGAVSWQQWAAPVTVTLTAPEPDAWTLELSSDGIQWNGQQRCTGTVFTVREWTLVQGQIEASFTATVYARVTDGAGLSATAQDTIGVDLSGLVQLAYGNDTWFTNTVPLNIRLLAPDGDLVCRVTTYVDQFDLGSQANKHYLGQEFVLANTSAVSRVKLGCYQIVGDPAPLHIKLVAALSNADPSGTGALSAWAGTVADVRISEFTYGFTYADLPKVTLPPGRYYLLLYTESVSATDYYRFNQGNVLYGGNGWYRHDYVGGAWQIVSNAPPFIGDANLQFSLISHDAGEMRLATDGVCDSETWGPFTSPFPEQSVQWPSQGLHTVCFEYRHPTKHEKDGAYYDSVVTDWTPPVVHSVSVSRVDAERRLLYLTSDVTDDYSAVVWMDWRLTGGSWSRHAYTPEITLPIDWVDSLEVRYEDRAGNATAAYPATPAQDFLPPTVTLTMAGGLVYVNHTEVLVNLVSSDNVGVEGVNLRERRTGHAYEVQRGGTVETTLSLPLISMPAGKGETRETYVDGEYIFAAQAFDAAGHVSADSVSRVVLDRVPPELQAVALTGPGGEPVTMTTQMLLRVEARDVIGPMQARCRVNQQAWGAWAPLQNGRSQIPLAGPAGVLSYTADVEVRDAVGYTVSGSSTLRVNRVPATPGRIRPGGQGYAGPSPLLVATPFSDPDGDARGGIEFVILLGENVVLRSGELENTDRYQLPAEWLELGAEYGWRVRTRDPYGAWSEWSEVFPLVVLKDRDRDGLPDIVEEKGRTDPSNPDSDRDGILDGLEDFDLDGELDPGESDPRRTDTDEDGLSDDKEDLDLDGELDPGETSPALADTDGDGMDDYKELLSGTDPCDGTAYFGFNAIAPTSTPGGFVVRWIGRNGRSYRLYSLEALTAGAPRELVTNVVATGGSAPWYATPVEVHIPIQSRPAWFRVTVDPE